MVPFLRVGVRTRDHLRGDPAFNTPSWGAWETPSRRYVHAADPAKATVAFGSPAVAGTFAPGARNPAQAAKTVCDSPLRTAREVVVRVSRARFRARSRSVV